MKSEPLLNRPTRRAMIIGGLALATLDPREALAREIGAERRINLLNARTGEHINTVYYSGGKYRPEVMNDLNVILRDLRAGQAVPIDPHLIDIVAATQFLLRRSEPFEVISGYRSPATNSMLRKRSGGVAKNSYHIRGMAMDMRQEGTPPGEINRIAKALGCGGVGLYTRSNFVHLDSGPVRNWGA